MSNDKILLRCVQKELNLKKINEVFIDEEDRHENNDKD